ncbi:MAG: aspartate ammonia-lyase [Firmicutes bacterium]|nr:aspartate ammonia-lyase [Bacillota bacterium]
MKIYSIETLREARRQGTYIEKVPFVLDGKLYEVEKKIINGEMETFELSRPIGEMLTSGSLEQFTALLKKVVLDVELGREQVQLLYQPIYEKIQDTNLPKVLDAKWALTGTVIFTEHIEGEEVKFGRLQAEQGPTARILTYAAGFEYTKEMKDFNEAFSVEILNRAIGEAYNALLNHIHLYPILSFNYPTANKTAYQGATGDPAWVGVYKTITKALADAAKAKRPGTVLLASTADQANIEMALKGGHQIEGTVYPAISGIQSVIYYDGWETVVGKKTYSYPGVTPGKAYLIRPKRGFKELVKQDLRVEATSGDLSRLVESQIVAYAYRGVYAAIEENVQELTLTA